MFEWIETLALSLASVFVVCVGVCMALVVVKLYRKLND